VAAIKAQGSADAAAKEKEAAATKGVAAPSKPPAPAPKWEAFRPEGSNAVMAKEAVAAAAAAVKESGVAFADGQKAARDAAAPSKPPAPAPKWEAFKPAGPTAGSAASMSQKEANPGGPSSQVGVALDCVVGEGL